MASRSCEVRVDKRRNGVRVAEIDEQYSAVGLRDAAKSTLKEWSLKDTERLITKGLGNMGGIEMTAAAVGAAGNQTTLDTWIAGNSDRVYFGNKAYTTMTDLSAGLATLTTGTAAELLTTDNLDEMKFIALNRANPKLRPIRSEKNGRHYFIVYAHPLAFRDLKRSTAMQQAQREVSLQMENERLFKGGDLHWDGLIIKEAYDLYEYSTLTGLGDSGTTTVVPAFLVGAQAIGAAYAKRWTSKEETFDYGDKKGVAIEAIYGIEKMTFGTGADDRTNPKDHGVLTGFFASSTVS
jgi:hypothetical protein